MTEFGAINLKTFGEKKRKSVVGCENFAMTMKFSKTFMLARLEESQKLKLKNIQSNFKL